ncbi:MAG: dephospho-CoA kinase [Thermodesulfovibrionia bacterium]
MSFIGLTGGLGMGKTTVLRFFKKSGAYIINADTVVHGLLKNRSIIKKLVILLGKDILIKKSLTAVRQVSQVSINKQRMADILFDNPQKRKAVEKILHPEVIKIAKKIKKEILNKNRRAIIVFEVPLLFEKGYGNIFDKIIVVYCSKAKTIKRLMQKGYSKEQTIKRMRIQTPISRKKTSADFLINNNSDINCTKSQAKVIFNKL